MEYIIKFFEENPIFSMCIDAYLALLIISVIVYFAMKIKKLIPLIFIGLFIMLIDWFSIEVGLRISSTIYPVVLASYIVICVVIIAPDVRKLMESGKTANTKAEMVISSSQATKEAIVDSVFHLSSMKVGALITIEQHNSLDQYAERAIQLNSDISRELLEQIFIKDSPLHDGGVIIRGNKIVCAGAYYVLTQDDTINKTVGSRHRAGIGISEVTDSLTIIVSEETGSVHVATAGCMVSISSKSALLEYIDLFLGK